ncbi:MULTISPECIES: lysophospholipid acyltransferase family protein [unclassified Paenibacillus]|uniref:lysophospholipid acyltransferase family protein n=1 Tax=unclassified Paenibacillus TaxID=185978 RepID=UPI0024061B02|nr:MULTISPECIES: lysophospholipid acyltransferase family protein [unclassified Paenibacillus]MDF9840341.1 1-acyl-sn-glycerol-3-phosphate acyltransferase [Paenibacillus sp. PastF-2]MDF9846923.1 1-acyl-sn-glycerol-3-phosphate acyltransferase [Paenibacillus sp. PastM-2]MDF9853495.1 1-acyl-sn-glycerol-3-phosphate acyltransferase [Paenibacillus sp. PastF-1]MDH6479018.1 1-acyl-sn-glycerol-3-phosphate acyltransferase [Paenibacillus sp. PastH-2]MDH6506750.1 1-acyl-sn-glycerol-3-phosphate acyltransfera
MIYVICRGLLRLIYAILFPLKIVGRENVPKEGGVLLCANHISLLDPMTIGIKLERQVKYMAKAELFGVPVLGWLIGKLGAFPVKRGGVSKESIKTALNTLRGGHVMGIFPEGTRNSDTGVAKKGAASFALRSGAAVVPAAIIGSYKPFRRMTVIYGEPIDLSAFDGAGSDSLEEVTDVIMGRIHEMVRTGKPSAR